MVLTVVPANAKQGTEPSKQMKQFLSFTEAQQKSIIGNAIIMIGTIASQTEPKIAKCLDGWYSASPTLREKRKIEILTTMKRLPQYTPEAVILAVIEKVCGKFKRANG